MHCNEKSIEKQSLPEQGNSVRNANPNDINLTSGYRIQVYAVGLDEPVGMVFAPDGSIIIGETGISSNNPRVLRLRNGITEVVAEGFNVPISGINYFNEEIYVSHKSMVTVIHADGSRQNILSGLPSFGDYSNNQAILGPDGKMYFGQGTATNSGVVGLDNEWVVNYPFFHDYPGSYIMLNGQNFVTPNVLVAGSENAYTGAFSPYGVANTPFESIKGIIRATGSIMRCNLDGTDLELVAWGFRNPFQIKFDRFNRLFAVNHGFDEKGSRPIGNAPDEFQLILMGVWYGWPDYAGGIAITAPRFMPTSGLQPEFLFTNHPTVPPSPFATWPADSVPCGFDFNYNIEFGPYGDAYVAELGAYTVYSTAALPVRGVGYKISRIDMNTRQISTFAINNSGLPASISGEGGFGRPIDLVFGPDQAMYILDLGINSPDNPMRVIRNTGMIWRISRI